MEYSCELLYASVFTVFCILLSVVYRYVCKLYTYFDKLEIQGPPPSFLIGTWKEAHRKFLGYIDIENAKIYGKVYGTFDGLTPNLMVAEPEIIKEILLTHADKFNDRRVSKCRNPVLKRSLSYFCGDDTKIQAMSNCGLKDSRIHKLIPRLESSADSLVRNVLKIKEEDSGLNLVSIVNDYIRDVIARVVFGIDLNSDVSFKDEFVSHCDQVLNVKNPNSRLAIIPFIFDNLQGDSWIMPQKSLDYFVNLIKSRINEIPRDQVSTKGEPNNLVELLVAASEEEKSSKPDKETEGGDFDLLITDEFIVSQCISAILSLINSTKWTVLLTIHCLAKEQEVQDELSVEIDKNKSEKLSVADLQNVQILEMIIAEVLRLYPSEFRLEKVCEEPVTIDKLNFVKGSRVSIPLYALHRHGGAEQEKFDPKRFSQEAIENRNPFCYLPFGQTGVSRYSITASLSLVASKITLFKLFEKFKFKPGDGNQQAVFKNGVTGVPKLLVLNVETELKN